jgi:formate dehydrogenase subunit delta
MDIHHMIKNANNIGSFFESEPDRAKATKGIADHMKNFWEKRMRREILSYVHDQQGAGLSEIVLEALRKHEQELTPAK